MGSWVTVRNRSAEPSLVVRARWCSSFACKLRGLSLRRDLPDGQGLLLVETAESRWASAIHMVGMLFDLGVVWISGQGVVVDTRHARPWRVYVPGAPARYTLEARPAVLERVRVGDRLEFVADAPGG